MKQTINRFSWSALRRSSVVAAVIVTALGGLVEGVLGQTTNDNFADALVLEGRLGTTNIDNTGYTAEIGEPNHAGQTASASAWFKWTAPVDGFVQFDTIGSAYDTVLAVYTGGTDISKLHFLSANDDIVGGSQNSSPRYPSLVKINAKVGQTYFIAVDGYGGAGIGGDVSLSWAYMSAGAFWFTADTYICSEMDGDTSGDSSTSGWSVLGARVTITRVAGAAGRVNLNVMTDTNALTSGGGGVVSGPMAVAGVDYEPINEIVTFDDWEMSKSLVIPIYYDSTPASNRMFTVSVAVSPEQAGEPDYILPPRVDPLYTNIVVEIMDYDVDPDSLSSTNGPSEPTSEDRDPSMVNFERSTYRRPESGSATIRVYRIGGDTAQTTKVAYNVDSGSANGGPNDNSFELEAGSDYATPDPATSTPAGVSPDFTPVSGTLEWGRNDTQFKTITIPILSDTLPEFNEDIRIRLFTVANGNAFLGNINECTLTILADPGDAPAGSLDPSFNPDYSISSEPPVNILPGANGIVYATVIQEDGKCLIGGNFMNYNTVPRNRIARVNVDGSHDASFNPGSGANEVVTCIAMSAGKPVIGGGFTSFNGQLRSRIARLNQNGSLDATFNPGLGADGTVWALAVQPDGKVVIGGEFTTVGGLPRAYIARLNEDGTLDETFNPTDTLNGSVYAIALGPDGKVYVGGQFTMAGAYTRNAVARLNADGSLDTIYETRTGVDGPVYSMVLKANGRLVIAGAFDTVDQRTRHKIASLNIDGTLDTSFNPGVGANDAIYTLAIQTDGRIFIGGLFTSYANNRRIGLARIFPDGSLDTSFMETAYNHYAGIPNPPFYTEGQYPQNTKNYLLALAIQDNGNVIIGGKFEKVGGGWFNSSIQTNTGSYEDIFDGYRREIYRNRQNLARVFGGETIGAGNIGFAADSYTVDENAQYLFVKAVRQNGTLGHLEATFSLVPQPPGAGVAEPTTDYIYNRINPAFMTSWGLTRSLSDGIFGTNNVSDMVTGGGVIASADDIYVTVPHRPGIQGARNTVMQLDAPSSTDIFFLGGANTPIGGALNSSRATATLRINEVDTLPGTISFTSVDYAVNENGGNAVITLTRTNGSSGTVSATFITTNGTAISPANYTAQNRTVTFSEGVTNQTVTVPIIDNTSLQNDDLTVLLTLRNPVGGATLGLSNAVLSIIDNDFPAGRLNLSSTNYTAGEYAGTARVTITRTGGSVGILDVQCRTVSGTAQEGVHFVGKTNSFHWNSGEATPRYMDVALLPDGLVTSNLSFNVRLSVPTTTSGAPIPLSQGARSNAVVTIVNQDFLGSPQFAVSSYNVDESAGYATLNVVRVNGSAETISVNYATSDGSAVSGGPLPNYIATNGTLIFGPGVVNRTITVPILNDGVVNTAPHFFAVTLSGLTPGAAVPGSPTTAQVLIKDVQSVNEPAGTLDPNFSVGVGFNADVNSLALESSGSILAGGAFTTMNGFPQGRVARILPNGSQDETFLAGLSGANGLVRSVISQTDLRVLVGGQFTTFNGVNRNYLTRLNGDGTLDTTFDPGSGADAPVYALAEAFLDGARKLYAGGSFTLFGGFPRLGLVRLNDNGTVDNSFNIDVGIDGPVYAMAVYPTNSIHAGKILIGGDFATVNNVPRSGIARLNTDGTLDGTFNPGAGANGSVRALALQLDGKVILGGEFTTVGGLPLNRVARLNLDGTVDLSFNVGAGMNDIVYALAIQPNNRIIVAGDFSQGSGVTRNRITRLMPDGTVDPTINFGSGANGYISSVVVQPDGNLVVGGGFTSVQGQAQNRVARLFGGAMTGPGQIEFVSSLIVVNENATNALVKLRRIGGTSGTGVGGAGVTTVNVVSADITAVAGVNYLAVNQPVSFPLGEVEVSLSVPVLQDLEITPDLYAMLYLDGSSELLGPQPVTFLQIVNVDSTLRFSSPTYTRNEDAIDGLATIQIVREGGTQLPAAVVFMTTTNGTAVAGVNYIAVSNTVLFQPGETVKNMTVPVLHNPLAEGDRTVTLELGNVTNSVLTIPYQAVLTIQDVDLAPGQLLFSAAQYSASEGAGSAIITVLRTNGLEGIVQVNITTVAGTALPGVRYYPTNILLNFADGQGSRSFAVTLIDDNVVQGSESLSLVMSNPSGGATLVEPTSVPLTILDDDVAVSFTSPVYVVDETNALVFVGVQRVNGTNTVSTVNLMTMDGTASAGTNYGADTRTLTFNVGETIKSVGIHVNDDPRVTGDLNFSVLLTNASPGVHLAAPNPAQVVIVDTDPGISLSNSVLTVLENATNLLVTVVRSNANSGDVSISFATIDQTAISAQDYLPTNGVITFLNGEVVKTFPVRILDNPQVQDDRTFLIQLSNPTGGAQLLEPSLATALIVDNEAGLRFSSSSYAVVENQVFATVTVQRDHYTNSTVSVDYATENGTAVSGVDYIGASGTLVFTNGETSKTFTVGLADDTVLTGDRTVFLKLFNPSGAAAIVTPGAATLLIRDDDGSLVVPAGTALVSESNGNGVIDTNETVTILFGLRNSAGLDAQNVTATLLATNGVTPVTTVQNYGALPVGGVSVSRPYTFAASATNGQTIVASFILRDNGVVIGTALFTLNVGSSTLSFTNGSPITINDKGANPSPVAASPYPSTINITSFGGVVGKLTVTFANLTHLSGSDIGALLVSPTGQKTLLMANAGGFLSANNVTLTFDDSASLSLPTTSLYSGVFKPTSYPSLPPFPIPAPAGPYSNSLSAFNGINPNGLWSLYMIDDNSPGAGIVSNGWSMTFTRQALVPAAADLSLTAAVSPVAGTVGANRTHTLWVTNHGPATAASVVVTNLLPLGEAYVSGTTANGTVSNASGVVRWLVGNLANGASASLTLVTTPTITGAATNLASVQSAVDEVYANNNAITLFSTVGDPRSDLVVSMSDSPDPVSVGAPVTYVIVVTNLGPSLAQNVTITNPLPVGATFNSVAASQGSSGVSGSIVWSSLGNLAAGNHATVTLVVTPFAGGTLTNTASALSAIPDPLKANNVFSIKTVVIGGPPGSIAAEAIPGGIRLTTTGLSGYILEQAPSLSSPVIWVPVMTNPPAVLDLPATNGSQFFRLRPMGP